MVAPKTHQYSRLSSSSTTDGSVYKYWMKTSSQGWLTSEGRFFAKHSVRLSLETMADQTTTLRTDAQLALLEAIPHYIIDQFAASISESDHEYQKHLAILLVRIVHNSSCASIELQHAIGLSLTILAVLKHPYPGWKRPLNDHADFQSRAVEVYRYHKTHRYEHSELLVAFGLLGLLRSENYKFSDNDVSIILDALKEVKCIDCLQLGVHTLPTAFSLKRMATETMLKYTQAVLTMKSPHSDATIARILLALSTLEFDVSSQAKRPFKRLLLKSMPFNNTGRWYIWKFCFEVLSYHCSNGIVGSSDIQNIFGARLDLDVVNKLVSLSLGEDDVYAAPAAMRLLWMLISPPEETSHYHRDNNVPPPLEVLRNTEALPASIRNRLASQPTNKWAHVFTDMWYPLLEELCGWKTTARSVQDSGILQEMRVLWRYEEAWQERIRKLWQMHKTSL
ncbi:transmembrane protein [Ceratobasidium sp. AG-Ba]|nr:transmembrane protein [Ceratobasidium sp. AG-Ba]